MVSTFWSWAVFLRLSTGISSFFASAGVKPAFLSSSALKPLPSRCLSSFLLILGFMWCILLCSFGACAFAGSEFLCASAFPAQASNLFACTC